MIPFGPIDRRGFTRLGLGGLGSLTLPGLFARRAFAQSRERTALIVVWLQGGASHLETYDPKPNAPSEIRGPFKSIPTNVPGIKVCELLPLQARIAEKCAILRSLVHTGFCHQQGNQQLMTGHPVLEMKNRSDHPDLMSIAHHVRGDADRVLPSYVALNPIPYVGSAYLGPAHDGFDVSADPNLPGFRVANLSRPVRAEADRMGDRLGLKQRLDALSRDADQRQRADSLDAFQQQALNMLTRPEVARAFDVEREDPRLRDRYGRNTWGQRCLLARRLIEAGVDLITTSFHGPLCGRVGNWDDHAVNAHVFEAMKARCVYFDRAVSTLIEDLFDRGMNRRVMVVVVGEFGRTPRINYQPDSATGVSQPGRDHWPRASSLLFAGGSVLGGQVIGSTDRLGADVSDRRVGVRDVLATMYAHLGIDAASITLNDPVGRPIPVLPEGQPIAGLV